MEISEDILVFWWVVFVCFLGMLQFCVCALLLALRWLADGLYGALFSSFALAVGDVAWLAVMSLCVVLCLALVMSLCGLYHC